MAVGPRSRLNGLRPQSPPTRTGVVVTRWRLGRRGGDATLTGVEMPRRAATTHEGHTVPARGGSRRHEVPRPGLGASPLRGLNIATAFTTSRSASDGDGLLSSDGERGWRVSAGGEGPPSTRPRPQRSPSPTLGEGWRAGYPLGARAGVRATPALHERHVGGRCRWAEAPMKGYTAPAGWPPATKPQDPAWEHRRLRGLEHPNPISLLFRPPFLSLFSASLHLCGSCPSAPQPRAVS